MQFICQNERFDIIDPILLSSKTIQHLQLDCNYENNTISIPDIFLDIINYSLQNTFDKNLKLLEFYDFLNVDENYIIDLSYKIGEYIEQTQPDLTLVQKNILLKYYPILNYYEKYGDKNLCCYDLPKYVTPYFHKNIKSYKLKVYCKYGNLDMVKYLLSLGKNIREKDNHAVVISSENGHLEVVKYLAGILGVHQPGVNIKDQLNYAVGLTSANGHLEIVKYLVSLGADITSHYNFAVRRASENGHLEVVKYLVSLGANIRAGNDYAVRQASWYGHIEVVKYLVLQGANIRAANDYAVKRASENDHLKVVNYLISIGSIL